MKRLICALIALLLVISCASAEYITSLKEVQTILQTTNPRQLIYGENIYCRLNGTIVEALSIHGGDWYIYRIECDEEGAQTALIYDYDKPCFRARGYDFEIGDVVVVEGFINVMYSSITVPYIGDAKIILQRSHNAPVIP